MKLPVAMPKDAIESTESSHVPIQRKRGRPSKAELLAEKKQKVLELTESGKTTSPTFEHFQKLPEELRLEIWKLALPGPRLIEISFAAPKHSLVNSHRSTPSILHVCSESRKEALKWYTAFPLGSKLDPLRAVYVNFQIDTLYFNDDTFRSMYWGRARYRLSNARMEQLMNHVRFIAIGQIANDRSPRRKTQTVKFIHRFPKLEELTVVAMDVGIGEITDEHKLHVWKEWQIGELTRKYLRRKRERPGEWAGSYQWLNHRYHFWCFRARAGYRNIETDRGRGVDVALMIKWAKTMAKTMDCDVLKDVKARIVAIDRK